jgi:anti-anti-sigma regulatory factor
MYQITLDDVLQKATIFFSEPLTILNSLDVTKGFLDIFSKANTICINHENVDEFDLSYLQNLFALHKHALEHNKEIMFSGKHPDSFVSLVKRSGCPTYSWIKINDL